MAQSPSKIATAARVGADGTKFVENMFVAVITLLSENAGVILSAFSPSYIENGNLRLFRCVFPPSVRIV